MTSLQKLHNLNIFGKRHSKTIKKDLEINDLDRNMVYNRSYYVIVASSKPINPFYKYNHY